MVTKFLKFEKTQKNPIWKNNSVFASELKEMPELNKRQTQQLFEGHLEDITLEGPDSYRGYHRYQRDKYHVWREWEIRLFIPKKNLKAGQTKSWLLDENLEELADEQLFEKLCLSENLIKKGDLSYAFLHDPEKSKILFSQMVRNLKKAGFTEQEILDAIVDARSGLHELGSTGSAHFHLTLYFKERNLLVNFSIPVKNSVTSSSRTMKAMTAGRDYSKIEKVPVARGVKRNDANFMQGLSAVERAFKAEVHSFYSAVP